ncbi:hypothetical protein Salpa_5795 [Sporomusa sp. KB1]|jgi:hypothetical protein|nr:hypothetical protein Salpa_5795 [Sporomusa sp. KB1]
MAARPLLAAFRWRCTLLIRSRSATATLRVVSCRASVHSLGREGRPEHSLSLAPGLRGTSAGPAQLRGAPAGHSGRPGRNTTGRPSRASCRSPGTENKVRSPENGGNQPLCRATWCHSPGQVASKPFVPCRGRARPAPWTRKACVHSPSSLPPEPPIPPEWRCRPSCGPRLKFGGKGGLRAP